MELITFGGLICIIYCVGYITPKKNKSSATPILLSSFAICTYFVQKLCKERAERRKKQFWQ